MSPSRAPARPRARPSHPPRAAARLTVCVPACQPSGPQPPSDPEVRKAADKLAEFVAKSGRSLEQMTRDKNPGNTVFK